jgi:hypothetical protein
VKIAKGSLTRRDLIKAFGMLAFALTPVARAMGYVAGGTFQGAPRFVLFFKGGSFHAPTMKAISSLDALDGTPIAPLAPYKSDIVLFRGMSIHGGEPKTDGYQEEHGAGLFGSVTGDAIRYTKNDSYFAYTDHESIDVAIANHYATTPATASLPFPSLHVGAGAHSDADNLGLGQRYISFKKRQAGDSTYGNAVEPVQDAGQVYDTLMQRVSLICAKDSNQPATDNSQVLAALNRKKSLIDFRLDDIAAAKRTLGMDAEHSQKLDGLVDGWREVERANDAQIAALGNGAVKPGAGACPTNPRPTGNGANKSNLDDITQVHDQMIGLIKLAFEWDLTRVVAFTLSGASSGQRMPSRGVTQAHHSMEHGNNVKGLNIMGNYYSEKFAALLSALKGIDDGDGKTALFNSSVLLAMECWSDSASGHYLTDIPFILAGQGAGKFQTGRIVDAARRNNNDLLVSLQNASGIQSNTFGLASLNKGPII